MSCCWELWRWPASTRAPRGQRLMTRVTAYAFTFKGLDGDEILLSSYAGHPLLVVNTASLCGYTPQYAGLQTLWTRYRDRGLVILAAPSNDFGGQEPGSVSDIHTTAQGQYHVTFPITEKVAVKGNDAHPFYKWVAAERPTRRTALEFPQISDRPRWVSEGGFQFSSRTDGSDHHHGDRKGIDSRLMCAIESRVLSQFRKIRLTNQRVRDELVSRHLITWAGDS